MDMGMDGSTGDSQTPADIMMVPWLHFTAGDYLFFETWRPTSKGAIAGACIGLVLFSIFDRWVAAARGNLEHRWRHRGLASAMRPSFRSGKTSPTPSNGGSEKSIDLRQDEQLASSTPTRTIPPFILAHDLPRGLIHAAQSALVYLLMLAVMTFNVPFIISIIGGLGLGEMIFGRMGNGRSAGH